MKNKKYFIIMIMIFVLLLFTGCSKHKYDVKIINENFEFHNGVLENYMTYGAFDEANNNYINDISTPEDFTLVIKNEKQLDEMFSKFPNVNFEKEMIIIYIYTGIYNAERKITEVEYEHGELSIDFDYRLKPGTGSASIPMQRVLIIKMKLLDVYEVDIDED
jgi:hypothetical protein